MKIGDSAVQQNGYRLVFLLYMPHQAALALDLASGQLVFAPLVGVAAGLEFDSDGCAA